MLRAAGIGLAWVVASASLCAAQTPAPVRCSVTVVKVRVPVVTIFADWQGGAIGTMREHEIAVGARIDSCAPNSRMRLVLPNKAVWIESFAVETRLADAAQPQPPAVLNPFDKAPPPTGGQRAQGSGVPVLTAGERPRGSDSKGAVAIVPRPAENAGGSLSTLAIGEPSLRNGDFNAAQRVWDPRQLTGVGKSADPPSAHIALLGQFGDWSAFQSTFNNHKMCYALSKPKNAQADLRDPTKSPSLFFVSQGPDKRRNEVSLQAAYIFKRNTGATLEFGSSKFDFYTLDQSAWTKDLTEEMRILGIMRNEKQVVVRGFSDQGVQHTDVYSLVGFAQASDLAAQYCK